MSFRDCSGADKTAVVGVNEAADLVGLASGGAQTQQCMSDCINVRNGPDCEGPSPTSGEDERRDTIE